jgi:acetyl-CoA/propionyl-CoA carboxylase biotin carboxyl carrier protein
LRCAGRTDEVRIAGTPQQGRAQIADGAAVALTAHLTGDALTVILDGVSHRYTVAASGTQIWLAGEGRTSVFDELVDASVRPGAEHSGDAELRSPMPGSVVAVSVHDGESVEAGTVVVAVEAMKMEHELRSPVTGVVELLVAVGDQVKVGQLLARITANTEGTQQ